MLTDNINKISKVSLISFLSFALLHLVTGNLLQENCEARNFKKIFLNHDDSDFVLYGLTQDCQLFFARADQLHLLNQLRVQPRVTYCLPELVQLHWRELHTSESIGLELIFKRASHQICALPLEFPSKHALAGNVLFSYSISSAMNYARCSYITNTSFVMEPDLSFMDSTFGDVIYFVDPQSTGSFWTIRQFKLDRDGLRHSLETFIVKNYAESHKQHRLHTHKASEFLLGLDAQRRKLLAIHRHTKQATSVCAYDLLFRPHKAHIREHIFEAHGHAHKYRINSFAADGNFSIFGEFHQVNRDHFNTMIKLVDLSQNNTGVCLFQLPFLVEIGLIRLKSLENLKQNKLPPFARPQIPHKQLDHDRKGNKSSHHHAHPPSIHETHHRQTTLPTTKPATTTSSSFLEPHIVKPSKPSSVKNTENEKEFAEKEESNELGFLTEITTKEIGKEEQKDGLETEASGEQPIDEAEHILRTAAEQNITTESLNGLPSTLSFTSSFCNCIIMFMVFLFNL